MKKRSSGYLIYSLTILNELGKRHCVTLNHKAFSRLKKEGRFGESYSSIILRILDCIAPSNDESSISNIIKFTSKKCKENNHKSCPECWCGLGFQIICDCMCHNRKEVEGLEGSASTIVGHPKSGDFNDARG